MSEQPMKEPVRDPAIFLRDIRRSTRTPIVTMVVVAINVALFAIEVATHKLALWSPTPTELIQLGANTSLLSFADEPWRLWTSMFLHVGLLHIVFNMLVLWQSGPLVERIFGSAPFVVLYGVAGLGGAMISASTQPHVVSAGASGAIFGLFGGLGGYLLRYRAELPREIVRGFGAMVLQFVAYNVAIGFLLPFVDMGAHLGGLGVGVLAGLLLATPPTREGVSMRPKRAALAGAVLSVALCAAWIALRTGL